MWHELNPNDLRAVMMALESEKSQIVNGDIEFEDDAYATAQEKRSIELKDLDCEISSVKSLLRGNRIAQGGQDSSALNERSLLMYPYVGDVTTLKKLLLIFDSVSVVLPYALTEKLEPNFVEIERSISTSWWSPREEEERELEELRNAGLVNVINVESENQAVDSLLMMLYDRSLKSELEVMTDIDRASYVNSREFELDIRLLECTTLASSIGGIAVSQDLKAYERALELQRLAWTGLSPEESYVGHHDSANYIEAYAGLSVLSHLAIGDKIQLEDLLKLRDNPGRRDFVHHLQMLSSKASKADSTESFNEIAVSLIQELNSSREQLKSLQSSSMSSTFTLPLVGTIITIVAGGSVGMLSLTLGVGALLTGLLPALKSLWERRTSSGQVVSAANYLASIGNPKERDLLNK